MSAHPQLFVFPVVIDVRGAERNVTLHTVGHDADEAAAAALEHANSKHGFGRPCTLVRVDEPTEMDAYLRVLATHSTS